MALKISKSEIKDFEKLKVLSQLTLIKDKMKIYEKKYKKSFNEFEKFIKSRNKENFNDWDDYIEWKAYMRNLQELKEKLKEIELAKNITIT